MFQKFKSVMNRTVWVAGLGYFVDLFDIALFGVVRSASLLDIGVPQDQILAEGIYIYNAQMIGLMLGGILWGIWADKKGRLSVLFGSILMYSLGNLANVFVTDVHSYALCRFFTGFGLAGELGAAITLVAESLPKENRGLGTTVVATLGLLGSVTAAYVGQLMHWKTAYLVGGILGILLLFMRVRVFESGLFSKTQKETALLGSMSLLLSRKRFSKYLRCILIGVPIYFATGVLFTFSPELTKDMNLSAPITAGNALLWGSIGLALGDLLSGVISQFLQSRKKSVFICLLIALIGTIIYLNLKSVSVELIYFLCFLIGTAAGYWAVLVTMAAEQFGTNLRGTVATSVPNFVRGSATITVSAFGMLKNHVSLTSAALIVGGFCFSLAFLALYFMEETFHKDLDFVEE